MKGLLIGRSWGGVLRLANRTLPLPTNERAVRRSAATVSDAPGAVIRTVRVPATGWVSKPAEAVQGSMHPALAGSPPEDETTIRVAALADAAVEARSGIVYGNDGRPIAETSRRPAALARVVSARRRARPHRLVGKYATLLSEWSDNYYHWVADDLVRFLALERAGFGDLPLLVPRALRGFQRDSLVLLGVVEERIVPSPAEVVTADSIVWPGRAEFGGAPPSWACNELRSRLVRAVDGQIPAFGRRLLVSRAAARHRRVVNEDELAHSLAPYGFERVCLETLPFAQQVALFRDAEIVVAAHGAGLANAAFAHRATFVELFEPDWVNPCYYRLVDRSGNRYRYVIGEAVAGPRTLRSLRDIRVPVREVVASVERAAT